ncbi:MBL fold metallo-hydrolase [Streptomyces sp. KM273126]|uniref:MBL fold metallo-hydrolase n=1 Tax=Streptomyces sp. KM273126 TaxID=2545247 RepID=UPI00103C16C6|nr:MBL fold metallo-hydrolase [Streptomyces sp. KM273126]MBA2812692.1 MBL fold metallo-hydrolase [Streptomyces sp. KM273126]
MTGRGPVRVERVVTSGTFSLDGETFDVDDNVRLVGDDAVFTGDALFHGGPGATGRSYPDRPTTEASLRERLLTLPGDSVVHTRHGQDTTIAAERHHVPAA